MDKGFFIVRGPSFLSGLLYSDSLSVEKSSTLFLFLEAAKRALLCFENRSLVVWPEMKLQVCVRHRTDTGTRKIKASRNKKGTNMCASVFASSGETAFAIKHKLKRLLSPTEVASS